MTTVWLALVLLVVAVIAILLFFGSAAPFVLWIGAVVSSLWAYNIFRRYKPTQPEIPRWVSAPLVVIPAILWVLRTLWPVWYGWWWHSPYFPITIASVFVVSWLYTVPTTPVVTMSRKLLSVALLSIISVSAYHGVSEWWTTKTTIVVRREWSRTVDIPLGYRMDWDRVGYKAAYAAEIQTGKIYDFPAGQVTSGGGRVSIKERLEQVRFKLTDPAEDSVVIKYRLKKVK